MDVCSESMQVTNCTLKEENCNFVLEFGNCLGLFINGVVTAS